MPPLLALALPALRSMALPIVNKIMNTVGHTVNGVINSAVDKGKSSALDIVQNPQQIKNKIFF